MVDVNFESMSDKRVADLHVCTVEQHDMYRTCTVRSGQKWGELMAQFNFLSVQVDLLLVK